MQHKKKWLTGLVLMGVLLTGCGQEAPADKAVSAPKETAQAVEYEKVPPELLPPKEAAEKDLTMEEYEAYNEAAYQAYKKAMETYPEDTMKAYHSVKAADLPGWSASDVLEAGVNKINEELHITEKATEAQQKEIATKLETTYPNAKTLVMSAGVYKTLEGKDGITLIIKKDGSVVISK